MAQFLKVLDLQLMHEFFMNGSGDNVCLFTSNLGTHYALYEKVMGIILEIECYHIKNWNHL